MAGQICIITPTGMKCLSSPMHQCDAPGKPWTTVTQDIALVAKVTAAVKTFGDGVKNAPVLQRVLELLLQSEDELHGPFTIVKQAD
jgi:hypothetical protein